MSSFDEAIGRVLENEGGLSQDKADPGGTTKYGISQRSYPNLDIVNLTVEQAKDIYRRDFWRFSGVNSQAIATKLLDASVNTGKIHPIRWAQEIVGTHVDGIYGADTEHHINLMDEVKFLSCFRQWWTNYYVDLVNKNPALNKFLDGWLRRARQ